MVSVYLPVSALIMSCEKLLHAEVEGPKKQVGGRVQEVKQQLWLMSDALSSAPVPFHAKFP